MRNFNNIRTIDLKEYLPDVLKDVQEMRAIMEAETPEVQAIWERLRGLHERPVYL